MSSQVSSTGTSYPASASCLLQVLPPLGLTVLHPPFQNGSIFLQPSNTRLLLRVQSRYATTASRRGSNHSVTFQSECPPEFRTTQCQPASSSGSSLPGSDPSLFAVLDLNLGTKEQKGSVQVELEARSEVTEAMLVVLIQLEVPLRGLQVEPPPVHRVLMESVVVSVFFFLLPAAVPRLGSHVDLCFRATLLQWLKAPIPPSSGLWTTSPTSPTTTLF